MGFSLANYIAKSDLSDKDIVRSVHFIDLRVYTHSCIRDNPLATRLDVHTWIGDDLTLNCANRVDDPHPSKILLIVGYDGAIVDQRDSANDCVECTARSALQFALGHEARPDQGGIFVEGQYAASE